MPQSPSLVGLMYFHPAEPESWSGCVIQRMFCPTSRHLPEVLAQIGQGLPRLVGMYLAIGSHEWGGRTSLTSGASYLSLLGMRQNVLTLDFRVS